MKCIKVNRSFLWNCYVFLTILFTAVSCFPAQKPSEIQTEIRDEKRFPNGTTIGKYTYMDTEGNPIQVKYYADEASYGVELNSIKVVDRTGKLFQPAPQLVKDAPHKLTTDPDLKMAAKLLHTNHILPTAVSSKYRNREYVDPYDFLNKEVRKANLYKIDKLNPDYDIFYQNELKEGQKCSKDKVRLYFDDKDNRKVRSAENNLAEADKFCEQF